MPPQRKRGRGRGGFQNGGRPTSKPSSPKRKMSQEDSEKWIRGIHESERNLIELMEINRLREQRQFANYEGPPRHFRVPVEAYNDHPLQSRRTRRKRQHETPEVIEQSQRFNAVFEELTGIALPNLEDHAQYSSSSEGELGEEEEETYEQFLESIGRLENDTRDNCSEETIILNDPKDVQLEDFDQDDTVNMDYYQQYYPDVCFEKVLEDDDGMVVDGQES